MRSDSLDVLLNGTLGKACGAGMYDQIVSIKGWQQQEEEELTIEPN
jgi:hypothetical protein